MIYRIVKKGEYFHLQGAHPRNWFERLWLGAPLWHWIRTYQSLDDAKRGKELLLGRDDQDGTVVG